MAWGQLIEAGHLFCGKSIQFIHLCISQDCMSFTLLGAIIFLLFIVLNKSFKYQVHSKSLGAHRNVCHFLAFSRWTLVVFILIFDFQQLTY